MNIKIKIGILSLILLSSNLNLILAQQIGPKRLMIRKKSTSTTAQANVSYSNSSTNLSQENSPLSMVPLSPTASNIAKYGSISSNLNSGQISPSLPIYEIKLNDFTFPISLNYGSNGFKVNETAGWTGMGWSLNGMSTISRQVRGIPDELNFGYNGKYATGKIFESGTLPENDQQIPNWRDGNNNPVTVNEFFVNVGKSIYDSEPDMFFLNGPNLNEKFIFESSEIPTTFPRTTSQTKKATSIPFSDVKIQAVFNPLKRNFFSIGNYGTIDTLKVTDTEGVIYIYSLSDGMLVDPEEQEEQLFKTENKYNVWYLKEIYTPNGNNIKFEYTATRIVMPTLFSQKRLFPLVINPNYVYLKGTPEIIRQQTKSWEVLLSKIIINDGQFGTIDFELDQQERTDWNFNSTITTLNKPKSLKKILVKNGANELIKEFNLNYSNTPRLLLKSVIEKNDNLILPPTELDYYNENGIIGYNDYNKIIFKEDYWGFLNDCSENCERYTPGFQYTETPDGNREVIITGENKQPSFNGSCTGQLTSIKYPTGGSTRFEYESNDYRSLSGVNNPCLEPYVTLLGSVKFTRADYDPQYPISTKTLTVNLPPNTNIDNSCFKISYLVNIGNKAILRNVVSATMSATTLGGYPLWSKVLSVNPPNNHLNISGNQVSRFPRSLNLENGIVLEIAFSAETDLDVIAENQIELKIEMNEISPGGSYISQSSGGVRIKNIINCPNPSTNESCTFKEFRYKMDDGLTSGRLLSPLTYQGNVFKFVHTGGYIFPPGIKIYARVLHRELNSTSNIPILSGGGNHVYYDKIDILEGGYQNNVKVYNGSQISNYVKYEDESDVFISVNLGVNLLNPTISKEWRRGKIVNNKINDVNGKIQNEVNNSYFTQTRAYLFGNGVKIGVASYDTLDRPYDFTTSRYSLENNFHFLKNASNKDYFYSGPALSQRSEVESNTTFEYQGIDPNIPILTTGPNNRFFLTKSIVKNSKNENIITNYHYPFNTIDADLISSANMLYSINKMGFPLKTEVKKDLETNPLFTKVTYFSRFNNNLIIAPSITKTFRGNLNAPLDQKVIEYLNYDNYGNLQEYKQNGLNTSFLWSYYFQHPVIKAENTTIAQIRLIPGININTLGYETNETSIQNSINLIRSSLTNEKLVTSYSFKLGVGISSITEPNGLKQFFTYDKLGRLNVIENNKKSTLKSFDYKFKNQ